jgi:hypothetical protein
MAAHFMTRRALLLAMSRSFAMTAYVGRRAMDFPIYVTGLDADGVGLIAPTAPQFDELARPMVGRVADVALRLKPLLVIV